MATHSCLSVRVGELADKQKALLYGIGIGGTNRSTVVKDLQAMFELCYGNGVNPLPDLRKSYPALSWRFVSNEDDVQARELYGIANWAAFAWLLPNSELVSAKTYEDLAGFDKSAFLSDHDNVLRLSRVMLFARIQEHSVQ